jgi:hypothetical protein
MGSIHEKNQGPKILCYFTFKAGRYSEIVVGVGVETLTGEGIGFPVP